MKRFEAQLPFGDVARELVALPPLSVSVRPRLATGLLDSVTAEVRNHAARNLTGTVTLDLPEGFRSDPAVHDLELAPRQSKRFPFAVTAPSSARGERRIRVVVATEGRSYSESYEPIEHRDLETRYLVTPADVRLVGVGVRGFPRGLPSATWRGSATKFPKR